MVRSILHKDFLQEKYETLQERDVNPDDEFTSNKVNILYISSDGWLYWCVYFCSFFARLSFDKLTAICVYIVVLEIFLRGWI